MLLIDDGIAIGLTMSAAIQLVRHYHPQKIIVVASVATADAIKKLRNETAKLIVSYVLVTLLNSML